MKTKILLLTLLLVATVPTHAQTISNGVAIAWSPPSTNAFLYKVFVGTNSGIYQRSFSYTTTNGWLDSSSLFPGTNYVAVADLWVSSSSNAIWSPCSAEVQIVRIPASTLTITGTLLGATNLVKATWLPTTNVFSVAITPNQPVGFFQAALTSIQLTPDTVNILPPMP